MNVIVMHEVVEVMTAAVDRGVIYILQEACMSLF